MKPGEPQINEERGIFISFLIPALNEKRNITECINQIRLCVPTDVSYEIIIGDHGSTDDTAELVDAVGAQVVSQVGGTIASLRNHLVRSALANIVVFIDADIRLTVEWGENIEEALAMLSKSPLTIVGSPCYPSDEKSLLNKFWFYPIARMPKKYIGTGHIIFSKIAFDRVGGFDPTLASGEDFAFCNTAKEMGCHLKIIPELTVTHLDYPKTLTDFVRREIWHGIGDFNSIDSFFGSRVALVSVGFTVLCLLTIFATLCRSNLQGYVLGLLVLVPTLLSFYKFRDLGMSKRVPNIFLCSVYLLSRSFSFFYRGARKRIYSSKLVDN